MHFSRYVNLSTSLRLNHVFLSQNFACEAVTWQQLSHPNVLPFYGIYHLTANPLRLCLASPWMPHGNVVNFLADQTAATDCVILVSSALIPGFEDAECWCLQSLDVAQGLEYLHSQQIIHGDLKGVSITSSPFSNFFEQSI